MISINFLLKKKVDRHKWVTTYFNNLKFVNENTPKSWKISHYDYIFSEEKKFYSFLF